VNILNREERMKLKQKILGWFIGDVYARCPHTNVELIGVHPVTMSPMSGKCRECKKIVYAHTVWKTEK